jgi:hypothetical protein
MTSYGLLAAFTLTVLHDPGNQGPVGGCDASAPLPFSVSADSVEVRPTVIKHPRLESPRTLAMAGVTDEVLVEYDVDATGRVDSCSIHVLKSKRPEFATAATAYVSGLQLTPGVKDGIAVRTRIRQYIPFWQTDGARGRHHIF